VSLQRKLKVAYTSVISSNIRENRNDWNRAAMRASNEWATWHFATYSAYCRNNGDYSTKAQPNRNWNDEMIDSMREDLEPEWDEFVEEAESEWDSLMSELETIFDTQFSILTDSVDLAPNAIKNLIRSLAPRQHCIEDLVDDFQDQFSEATRNIESNAINGHASSYIVDAMISTYQACKHESGGGCDARRKGHMRQRLSSRTLFPELAKNIKTDHWKVIKEIVEKVEEGMRVEFDSLLRDLRTISRVEGEVTEAQRYPEVVDIIQKALSELDGLLSRSTDVIDGIRK